MVPQLDIRDPEAVKVAVDKIEMELGLPSVVKKKLKLLFLDLLGFSSFDDNIETLFCRLSTMQLETLFPQRSDFPRMPFRPSWILCSRQADYLNTSVTSTILI